VGNGEEKARQEAVARVPAGAAPAKVVADLGRTDRWVRKWVARYDPVLKGVTPAEHEKRLGFEARLLDRDFAPPTSLPRKGLIEFIARMGRSHSCSPPLRHAALTGSPSLA
jgi:hypothetical protein